MIETKTMQVRKNTGAYIDSNNDLKGTCNPLKFFVCPTGVDVSNNPISKNGIEDSINKLYCLYGFNQGITGIDNKINVTAGLTDIADSKTTTSVTKVNQSLAAGINDDILIVSCGEPNSSGLLTFGVNDNISTLLTQFAYHANLAGTQSSNITDSLGVNVTLAASTAITAGKDYMAALAVKRTANLTGIRNDATKVGISPIIQSTMIASGVGALTFNDNPRIILNTKSYAMGYFIFPNGTLPDNWQAMASWMGWNWAKQNYVFPDSWRNL